MDYEKFIAGKGRTHPDAGFSVTDPHSALYPFQRHAVEWALRKGRAALFEDCGLGKTLQQLVWAHEVCKHTGGRVLILAPLAVSEQTKLEGARFGIHVTPARCMGDAGDGITITNYEMLHKFDRNAFVGLVLDESSILKSFGGAYRQAITEFVKDIPYRLACTATPAPNDLIEITNHSDFLGVLSGKEVIALFFTQDGNTTHKWRLKGHARRDFWKWMASWALAVRSPSDLGYEDGDFVLPPLKIHQHIVDGHVEDGYLFPVQATDLQDRIKARRESIDERVHMTADLVNASTEPFLVWCALNEESAKLKAAIDGAVEVKGADSTEKKTAAMLGFSAGDHRVMVTKPSICGFGMNWQHCHKMAFVGLSDSWAQWYQAVRRCWRFGQVNPVTAHVIVADTEGAVVANIERKEANARAMMQELVSHMGQHYERTKHAGEDGGAIDVAMPSWIG